MKRPHHLPHKYEVVVPVGNDRPGLWEVGHNWKDRIPLIVPFEYIGDTQVLVDAVEFAASSTSTISATFGELVHFDVNEHHVARMVNGGQAELMALHTMLLGSLDQVNRTHEQEDPTDTLAIRFSNGRALGEGYRPHVLRPSEHGYEFEKSLGLVVLMRHIDSKAHMQPLKVFELAE